IEVLARREGIEVVKVNPAFTSIIGQLKYAPQYLLDKDVTGAFVIGRRGIGFREEIPENYLKLLRREEFLEYSLYKLEEKKKELKRKLEREENRWKKRAIREELKKINLDVKAVKKEIEVLKSSESNPATQDQTSGGNKLKPILVAGDWKRVVSRLVPVPGAGTIAQSTNVQFC
ncbi:MAG: DUF2192 domain-containing protein, partial [Deltaproteobacteria bacterium]|nr:DUF2192 domain-containing protein [Deltaproteobacteria bacterium]